MIRTRHRFTLVELLVVIAIITILASMLMPSLQKSRELSRRIVCVNSYKQIGIALFSYTNDYNDYVPGPSVQMPYVPTVFGGGANNFSAGCNLYINKNDPAYWKCPTNGAAIFAYDSRIFIINNILSSGYYFGYPYESGDLKVPKKLQYISMKSKNGWCASEINMLSTYEPGYNTIVPPHTGGYNVLYFDGHIQTLKKRLY